MRTLTSGFLEAAQIKILLFKFYIYNLEIQDWLTLAQYLKPTDGKKNVLLIYWPVSFSFFPSFL
jgi:hypothetical protein